MLPGSDDTRGESVEVGNIPVLLGAEISRIVGALDMRERSNLFVKDGFMTCILPNVVTMEMFRGPSVCPVDATLVVIVDWGRRSDINET
jgi:hypothetical protein